MIMTGERAAAAGRSLGSQGVHYTVLPATVRHEGVLARVHVVAAGARSALVLGAGTLRAGASVALTAGAMEMAAQVGWTDGARARLDTLPADDGELRALLGSRPGAGGFDPAGHDAAPVAQRISNRAAGACVPVPA